MGTSSIFGGRKDKSRLLPDDYISNDGQESKPWKNVKTELSKHVSSGGAYSDAKKIVRHYVKASGGASTLIRSSSKAIATAGKVGEFLYGIKQNGVYKTFRQLGIELEGKSINDVFSRLVDVLAKNASSKDDIVIRKATEGALVEVYDYVEVNNMDIDCLENIPLSVLNKALKKFISEYIWASFLKDLGSRIEDKMIDVSSAKAIESDIKGVIESVVSVEFEKVSNLLDEDIQMAMEVMARHSYEILEEII